jgi:DNA helicase IV
MVAMELARLHSEEGRRTLFLCYNAPLAEHLGRRAAGFEVQTFHKKCKRLVDGAGLSQRWPADPDADFFRDSAPELMTQALDRLPDERWDAVVIDEGQDFLELWWIPIEKMLRDRSTGFLQVFWDPNQDLYGGAPTESLGLTAIRLRYNCRNTRRIGSFAASLVEDSALFRSGAPDGDAVERIEVADEHGMADAVRRVLHRIVREEKVPTDRIVLLSTVRQERSAVLRTGKVGPFGLVDAGVATTGPDQIRCSTIHRFKGLEAEVVVLCDVAPGESWSPPNLLHVGASRAKHYLVEVSYGTRAN